MCAANNSTQLSTIAQLDRAASETACNFVCARRHGVLACGRTPWFTDRSRAFAVRPVSVLRLLHTKFWLRSLKLPADAPNSGSADPALIAGIIANMQHTRTHAWRAPYAHGTQHHPISHYGRPGHCAPHDHVTSYSAHEMGPNWPVTIRARALPRRGEDLCSACYPDRSMDKLVRATCYRRRPSSMRYCESD